MNGLPLLIESVAVLLKNLIISRAGCLLEKVNSPGIVKMLLLSGPFLVTSHTFQGQIHIQPQRIKCRGMEHIHIICNILQGDSTHPADRIGEIFINNLL